MKIKQFTITIVFCCGDMVKEWNNFVKYGSGEIVNLCAASNKGIESVCPFCAAQVEIEKWTKWSEYANEILKEVSK
jgi:hypothetical protein